MQFRLDVSQWIHGQKKFLCLCVCVYFRVCNMCGVVLYLKIRMLDNLKKNDGNYINVMSETRQTQENKNTTFLFGFLLACCFWFLGVF